jgi:hypothetical protein
MKRTTTAGDQKSFHFSVANLQKVGNTFCIVLGGLHSIFHGFVQNNACGNRHIERIELGSHWYGEKFVGSLG